MDRALGKVLERSQLCPKGVSSDGTPLAGLRVFRTVLMSESRVSLLKAMVYVSGTSSLWPFRVPVATDN